MRALQKVARVDDAVANEARNDVSMVLGGCH
jgi:hypothetical protein